MTIYYEKVGRRYVPVREYDSTFYKSLPKGKHMMIEINPGTTSYHYNVEPAFAPVLAAARYSREVLSKAYVQQGELRPHNKQLTPEQREAWHKFLDTMKSDNEVIEWPSPAEASDNVVEILAREAEKMLTVPAVKLAYEHFMLVYKLTKEENESNS